MGGAGVEREARNGVPPEGIPPSGMIATRGGITAQCCCYGSKRWDEDSKKRLKRCHGSKEWDDGSTQELLQPRIYKGTQIP